MKQFFSAFILCFFLCTQTQAQTFSDLDPNEWFYDSVITATELGLLRGYSDDTFRPYQSLTLAEFSTMLANAFYGTSLEIVKEYHTFDQWWEAFVHATHLRDGLRYTTIDVSIQDYIDRGYLFNRWNDYADQPLTRYDMAAMISNVLLDRFMIRYTEEEAREVVSHLRDLDEAYLIPVAMAYDRGLVSGKSPLYFWGESYLTRGEAAAVLLSLMNDELIDLEQAIDAPALLSSSPFNLSDYDYTGHLALENYIFARTNQLRVSKGLEPLHHSNTLVEYAYIRSVETETFFSHTRPDGSSWSTVFPASDTENRASGENLTMGSGFQYYQFADMIFKAWLNSPGHYTNMIDSRHLNLGIAVYVNDKGAYYATQMFGK